MCLSEIMSLLLFYKEKDILWITSSRRNTPKMNVFIYIAPCNRNTNSPPLNCAGDKNLGLDK